MAQKHKAEQEHVDFFWIPHFEEIKEGDVNFLGDPAVVDAIVRKFLADAIAVREAWIGGDPSAIDPKKWLEENTLRCARIFLGRSNDFMPINAEWNSPNLSGGIVANVRRRFDVKPASAEAILTVPFYALIQAYMEAGEEAGEGRDWEHIIDGAIELTVATLMGVDEQLFPFEVG